MKPAVDVSGKTSPKGPAVLALAVMFLLASVLPSFGLTFHIKLSGGFSFLSADDVNRSLSGWADYMKGLAAATPGWSFAGGKVARIRGAFDLEGEFLLGFARRWAVGIGSGFSFVEASESATTVDIVRSTIPYAYARPAKVSAVPLIVSGYRFFPVGRRVLVYAGAGAGWVQARYSDREAVKKVSSANFSYSSAQSASGRGSLVQGVAGAKFAYDESLGFFLEAVWRRAKVHELRDGTGTLYSYETLVTGPNLWQAKMSLLDAPPTGEAFRSVRKAVLDCGGLVLKLGFFIKF
jgi:hypothetical protein